MCRDKLSDENLIRMHGGNRFIELTDNGVHLLISRLAGGELHGDRVDEAFLRRLRVFTLLPLRLSREDTEALFWTLLLLYNDVFVNDFCRNLLESIRNDYREGLVNNLNRRLSNAIMLIIEGAEGRPANLVHVLTFIIRGYNMLMRLAYLPSLWCTYKFNAVALHTVVRAAAIILSGLVGRLLLLLFGVIYGIIIALFTAHFLSGIIGIILQLATAIITVFFLLVLAVRAPVIIMIYRYISSERRQRRQEYPKQRFNKITQLINNLKNQHKSSLMKTLKLIIKRFFMNRFFAQ